MAGNVTVRVHGPLFDGQADAALTQWLDTTRRDLADQAAAIVRSKAARMNKTGRGGTGRAAAAVQVTYGAVPVVTGHSSRGSVWWPWLEGTSRRNTTTPFRGYHAFRTARMVTQARAKKLAEAKLAGYLPRMGGR